MFTNSHYDRLKESFADQFEPDRGGFVYRKRMKGAPIQMTQGERDRFIADFGRRLRYGSWSIIPATMVLIGVLALLVPDIDSPLAQFAMYGGIAAILVPFLVFFYWAWNAPERELGHRLPAGPPRSKDDVSRVAFARISYGQLGLAVLAALLLIWRASAMSDVFHGWGVLWLVFAGALILAAAIQALRKWRLERDRSHTP
jgi:hypothetical protein